MADHCISSAQHRQTLKQLLTKSVSLWQLLSHASKKGKFWLSDSVRPCSKTESSLRYSRSDGEPPPPPSCVLVPTLLSSEEASIEVHLGLLPAGLLFSPILPRTPPRHCPPCICPPLRQATPSPPPSSLCSPPPHWTADARKYEVTALFGSDLSPLFIQMLLNYPSK